ncbi:MAG TPA: polymorphic toxin type 23 domain-containing protein, partial [Edaphocola sp.]|nr:polymorphic toxin type 23 domain-containing protein [Edaphocola sp.]
INRVMPAIPIYQSQGFNLSFSPTIGFGSSGFTLGGSLNASGQAGDFVWSASVGGGYNSGVSSLGEAVGGSGYWNAGGFAAYANNGKMYGGGYSYNSFLGGKTNQGIGAAHLQIGDFGLRFDEDFIGDGKDRFRTGGLLMTYRINDDVTLAFGGSMMTGQPDKEMRLDYGNKNPYGDGRIAGTYDNCGEDLFNLRGGSMYGGLIYKGQSFFFGHNSEKRLHSVQNWIHRNVTKTSPYFEDRMLRSRFYSYNGGYNPFYLFY